MRALLLPLFLLLTSSSQPFFFYLLGEATAAEICETQTNLPLSTDIHYIVINDIAAGDLLSEAHGFLFQQMYCGLNEAKKTARVKLDAWHIDSDSGECVIFNSDDSFANIRGKTTDQKIPLSHTPSNLCEKLEIASRCAASSKIMGDKVEIAVPLMNHEGLGKCHLERIFSFPDYKVTVFWTNDYFEKNDSSLPKNFDVVAFGSGLDFMPSKDGDEWISNDAMVSALRNGKTEMTKALKQRFAKMIAKLQPPPPSTTTTTTELPVSTAPVFAAAQLQNLVSTTSESPTIALELQPNSSVLLETTTPESSSTPQSTAMPLEVSTNSSLFLEELLLLEDVLSSTTTASNLAGSKRINLANKNFSALYENPPSEEAIDFKPFNKEKSKMTTTSITTEAFAEAAVQLPFYHIFGDLMGDPEHSMLWFVVFLISIISFFILLLLCLWWCCREPVKGKYEVLEKEANFHNEEPDPEAGIAYPTGGDTFIGKSIINNRLDNAKTKPARHVRFEDDARSIPQQEDGDDLFGSPFHSTPTLSALPMTTPQSPGRGIYSPLQLTPLPSEMSHAAPRSIKFARQDDTQTLPSLKALSNESLWSNER